MNLVKMKMEYYKYTSENESLEAVKQDGCALQYVDESCIKTRTITIDGKDINISE